MNSCWIVDHKVRPTFEKLTPKFKDLLQDSHKQVIKYLLLEAKNRAQFKFKFDLV